MWSFHHWIFYQIKNYLGWVREFETQSLCTCQVRCSFSLFAIISQRKKRKIKSWNFFMAWMLSIVALSLMCFSWSLLPITRIFSLIAKKEHKLTNNILVTTVKNVNSSISKSIMKSIITCVLFVGRLVILSRYIFENIVFINKIVKETSFLIIKKFVLLWENWSDHIHLLQEIFTCYKKYSLVTRNMDIHPIIDFTMVSPHK